MFRLINTVRTVSLSFWLEQTLVYFKSRGGGRVVLVKFKFWGLENPWIETVKTRSLAQRKTKGGGGK